MTAVIDTDALASNTFALDLAQDLADRITAGRFDRKLVGKNAPAALADRILIADLDLEPAIYEGDLEFITGLWRTSGAHAIVTHAIAARIAAKTR